MSCPPCLRFVQHKRLTEESVALGILDIEVEKAETLLMGQRQYVRHCMMGLTIGSKGSMHHCIAVVGQRPMEDNVVFQIEEVVAVGKGYICCGSVAAYRTDESTGVVVL